MTTTKIVDKDGKSISKDDVSSMHQIDISEVHGL